MMTRETWLILALAVLAAIAGGWLQHAARTRRADASPLLGHTVPAMRLEGLDGKPHDLAEYAGHRVLINLWAPWCGPCRREMPDLDRAQRTFGHGHAVVVGIAMDRPEAVRAYLAAHPVHYPVLLGRQASPDSAAQLGDTAGVLPYSLLLDADGTVRRVRRGRLDADTLADWLGD